MVVHPHPLSSVQSPLVLVSPQICHPDEKSFRKLNQGRFSPGCPPPLLIGPGSPCSSPSKLGGTTGAEGVCLRDGGGSGSVGSEKIYSCRE